MNKFTTNKFTSIEKLKDRINSLRDFVRAADQVAANEKLTDSLKEQMKQVVETTSTLIQQAIEIAAETPYAADETLRAAYLLSSQVYQYHYRHHFAWDTYLDPNIDYHDGSGGDRKLRLIDEQSRQAARDFLFIQEAFTQHSATQAQAALAASEERVAQAQKEQEELEASLNSLTKVDAYLLLAIDEASNDEEFSFFVELKEAKAFKPWEVRELKGLKQFDQTLTDTYSAGSTIARARGTKAAIAGLDKHEDVAGIRASNQLRAVGVTGDQE